MIGTLLAHGKVVALLTGRVYFLFLVIVPRVSERHSDAPALETLISSKSVALLTVHTVAIQPQTHSLAVTQITLLRRPGNTDSLSPNMVAESADVLLLLQI